MPGLIELAVVAVIVVGIVLSALGITFDNLAQSMAQRLQQMVPGGQAIGMRSMAIYELNADYVKFSRFMGIKDNKILRYVFRNAMLPQITGLALAIGTLVGGALVAEIIFSYPGLGTTILTAVLGGDYPLISATALIITVMVLIATFIIEILYGFIDPRIRAAQTDD